MKNKKKTIITICMIASLGMCAFFVIRLILTEYDYYTARKAYEELEENYIDEVENYDTADGSIVPIDVDFDSLKAINEDVIAWVYVGAVDISYPVLYSGDNDYYLRKGIDKEYLISGSIFLEGMNSPDFSDPHSIIYGHNMKDGTMFSSLGDLYTENLIENDDTFWIITPDAAYKYKIFSLNYALTNSYVYTLFFEENEEVTEYIENRINDSLLTLEVPEYSPQSKIVTLSTCGPLSGTQRFVVQGILIDTF